MRLAVIGSGVAGLSSAWLLSQEHEVDLFELEDYLGGHSNTVDVTVAGETFPVDTGFMVFNRRTYPNLIALFEHLGLETKPSDMSFSVVCGRERVEWSSSARLGMFAQPRNVLRVELWRMLYDMLRLSASAGRLLEEAEDLDLTLGELLETEGYGDSFIRWYLVPMAAAIWSTPTEKMLEFPAKSFLRFSDNHGLLHITGKPKWETLVGGSRTYVRRLAAEISGEVFLGVGVSAVERRGNGVEVEDTDGTRRVYDGAVLGTHPDHSLSLLRDPSDEEREILGAFRYQPNIAVLHTDEAFLPSNERDHASWNYYASDCGTGSAELSVTYNLNRLQRLPVEAPVLVTVNPQREPRHDHVLQTFVYAHPVFTQLSLAAQERLDEIQGRRNTWFCGAWQRYGFHEDGFLSALRVGERFGLQPPWGPVRELEGEGTPAPAPEQRSGRAPTAQDAGAEA